MSKINEIALRLLLGVGVSYGLSIQLGALLPLYTQTKVESAIGGLLLSVALYPILMLWSFASRTLRQTALIMVGLLCLFQLLIEWKG